MLVMPDKHPNTLYYILSAPTYILLQVTIFILANKTASETAAMQHRALNTLPDLTPDLLLYSIFTQNTLKSKD